MRSKHPLWVHLSIWLLVPALELYLSFAHAHRHEASEHLLEFAVFAALGFAQWRWAGGHWAGSLLCAGLVPLLLALVARAPVDRLSQFLYTIGALLLATAVLKATARRNTAGALAVGLGTAMAVAGTLGSHALDLERQIREISGRLGDRDGSFWAQYRTQLGWPMVAPDRPTDTSDAPPIVLVTVDTLRADTALEMESHRWLAERGRWWKSAMSTSSWTLPAVASIQTGLHPDEHGATCLYDAHCQGLARGVTTLAEALAARGYRTVAFTTNPWISGPTAVARGYEQVFDYASLEPFRLVFGGRPGGHPQDAAVLVDAALAWLERGPSRGYLLWLHLIDPHMPYHHTPELDSLTVQSLRAGGSPSAGTRSAIRDAYGREVEHMDGELMRLFDWLERDGFFERGLLVLTSDHGEEFWEHGGVEHGHSHHGEVMEVPLAMVGVGVQPGEDSGVASLVDIAPTVRAAAGLPPEGLDLRQPAPPDRIARAHGVMVGPMIRSARDATVRVIVRGDERFEPLVLERYDRLADPAESAPDRPPPEDPVARAALEIVAPGPGEAVPVNTEALRALGYVE